MDGLPTLTSPQPHASLVAERVKWIIDRSWPAPQNLVGRHIGIHAGAKSPKPGPIGDYFVRGFGRTGWALTGPGLPEFRSVPRLEGHIIPRKAIVATARLTACVEIIERLGEIPVNEPCVFSDRNGLWLYHGKAGGWERDLISDQEPYGQFEPYRYAWLLDDIKPTSERCPWCWGQKWDERHRNVRIVMDNDCIRCDLCGDVGHARRHGVCPVCDGAGSCEPMRAKGKQRLWRWTPEATPRDNDSYLISDA